MKENVPNLGQNTEQNKPERESQGEISRREFLRDLGMTFGAIGLGLSLSQKGDLSTPTILQKWQIEQSEKNWEAWQREMLKQLQKALDYLDTMDLEATAEAKVKKQAHIYRSFQQEVQTRVDVFKILIKQAHKQKEKILGLIPEVQNLKMYKGYLEAFTKWVNSEKDASFRDQDLDENYESCQKAIYNIELFINNLICSEKIKNEYGVFVTGENTRFFLADIKSIHEALQALPHFAIKKSGFKKLTLAETMPGSGAQMGESEMTGEFKESYLNASIAYHELAHAFDGNVEKGSDHFGRTNINKGAKPYLYSSGAESIEAERKNPSATYSEAEDILGYANEYGWKGNISEDKATVSAALFSQYGLRELINRSVKDPILKRKVEFMTGHRLDQSFILNQHKSKTDAQVLEDYLKDVKRVRSWTERNIKDEKRRKLHLSVIEGLNPKLYKFGTPLTEKDYQDAGFSGFCYWPVWSRDDQGKVWMDAKYFNAILEGKKVTFSQEDGQTIKEISPAFPAIHS